MPVSGDPPNSLAQSDSKPAGVVTCSAQACSALPRPHTAAEGRAAQHCIHSRLHQQRSVASLLAVPFQLQLIGGAEGMGGTWMRGLPGRWEGVSAVDRSFPLRCTAPAVSGCKSQNMLIEAW